LHTD